MQTIVFGTVVLITLILLVRAQVKLRRFSKISNLEDATKEEQARFERLKKDYEQKSDELSLLKSELATFEDDHNLILSGFYRHKYEFGNSKIFAEEISKNRELQKDLIRNKKAIVCDVTWSVGGSVEEGKKMQERTIKLGLSAFNVQCDNEVLSVSFDNIDRSQKKFDAIRKNIDKLLSPTQSRITEEFFQLKLKELFLAYEYQVQKEKEQEEQRVLREQAKEEERARREAERAQKEAERDEVKFSEALERVKKDLESKSSLEREQLLAKVAEMESQLEAAHQRKERAKSLAEQTRRGHVYIISNIGSFGENVFKTGMTRRLDPMDRIWELGDASVPFDFDVHGMVWCEDAPMVEKQLHEKFSGRRVNRVNERKEFFKVSLSEISKACSDVLGRPLELTMIAEAKEFRQTIALNIDQGNKAA